LATELARKVKQSA